MFNNLMDLYLDCTTNNEGQKMIRATVFEMYRDGFITEEQYGNSVNWCTSLFNYLGTIPKE